MRELAVLGGGSVIAVGLFVWHLFFERVRHDD